MGLAAKRLRSQRSVLELVDDVTVSVPSAVADPAAEICASAQELAVEIWLRMELQLRLRQRLIDERAFTDWPLMTMHIRHWPLVQVGLFSGSKEALTGADFEWWIGDGAQYLPMLVQAKRIKTNGRYLLRKRISKGGVFQLEQLQDTCDGQVSNAAEFTNFLPTLMFYNGPVLGAKPWPQDRCCINDDQQRGCALGNARAIWRDTTSGPRTGRGHVSRVGPLTLPWACLLCRAANPSVVLDLLRDPDGGDRNVHLRQASDMPDYMIGVQELGGRGVIDAARFGTPGASVVIRITVPPDGGTGRTWQGPQSHR
jgi:hypothetical protein